MKRLLIGLLALAVLAAAARADVYTAGAGTGGVTKGTFVKLSAAGTVVTATGVGDSCIGVCEQTAAANALTKYSGPGSEAVVTSGEAIAVGDLVTAGTGGKAFVLDDSDSSDQRYAALALTAATDADQDVTVIVVVGSEQSYVAPASLDVGGGYGSTGVSISAAGVIQANGAITSDGAITGGSIKDATMTITGGAAASLTLDGDTNTVQDLGVGVHKVATTVTTSQAATPFVIVFTPTAPGTYRYTVPAGKKLRVIDAWGFKTDEAGDHGDDELTLQNNDGTPANIFDKEELNAVGDGSRFAFDVLADTEHEVAATNTLDLVANDDGDAGCNSIVYVTCLWVTP